MPIVEGPLTPAQAGWEEVYGSDYPYSWQGANALVVNPPYDAPVIANGLCRVRYDTPSNARGFKIDVWDVPSQSYVEQGKVYSPLGASFLSAQVMYWTPERGVIELVVTSVGNGRQRMLVTLHRGWVGPRIEVYGQAVQPRFSYAPLLADPNDSVIKFDAAAVDASSAPSGVLSTGAVGAATFTGLNDFVLLRQGSLYQVNFAVLQSALTLHSDTSTAAYGTSGNVLWLQDATVPPQMPGYISCQLGFGPAVSDQILEAEAIRNPSGTTVTMTDVTASAGSLVSESQTAATNPTISKAVTNLLQATYRIMARVKVDSGVTGSFRAAVTGVTGGVATTTSTAWVWVDLGELTPTSAPSLLSVTGWASSGAGLVYIDRTELVLVADQVRAAPGYYGSHDLGQQILYDQRTQGRKVTRA